MNKFNRNKKIVRVVTFALLQVFLGWNLSSAAVSDRSLWHQRGKLSVGTSVSGNSLVQEDLQKSLFSEFFVPENAGTINEFWVPAGMTTKEALSSSKLLIHIRDAHCNYEAQTNIAKIIENFAKTNKIGFVGVEGAEGKIDYSSLNSFANYDVRRDVSDFFMEQGRLCGAEFANINADKYFTLFGVEKSSVYNSNLDNFRANLKFKEEGLNFVGQVKSALEALKAQMYTPELKDIEEKLALYNNREISFVDYCQYLYNHPAAEKVKSGYKNFALLMEAIKAQELVDFSQVDAEKDALISELSRNASSDEILAISSNVLDFRLGKLSTAAFYNGLRELAAEKKVDLASYKNLKPYMVYLSVYEKINSSDLFKEKETLEAEVKRALFKSTEQARLDKLSKNAEILEKIFSIRLTNDDLKYFKNNRTDFTAYEFESFINAQAPKYQLTANVDFSADPLEKYLGKLEAFYNEAKTRDDLLVQNTLSQMELEGANIGIVVAGGFHTAGMTAYLRSKNVPHMVVTPRILKEDVNNPYLKLISGENLPVEKLLSLEHLFGLAVPIKEGATKATLDAAMNLADPRDATASVGTTRVEVVNNRPFLVFKAEKGADRQTARDAAVAQMKRAGFNDIDVDPASPILEFSELNATALRGDVAAPQNAALISRAVQQGDALAVPLGSVAADAFGARISALIPVVATFPDVDEAAARAVLLVSPKDSRKYPYPGMPLADTPADRAVQEQEVGRVFKNAAGQDEAGVSDSEIIVLLARAQLSAPAQAARYQQRAAAIAAHEALRKAGKTDAQAKAAADDIALAGTPFEGQRLSDAFEHRDLKGVSVTPELLAAQAALRTATDAFRANPSREAALQVVQADIASRVLFDGNNSEAKKARAEEDLILLASLDSGFLGLDVASNRLVRSSEAPELGQPVAVQAETRVPASVTALLAEKGVTSVVVGGTASAAAKAQVLQNLLAIDRRLTLADAVALNDGVTGAIALLVNDGSNLRLVIQSTVPDADATSEGALAAAYALANGQGVAPESNDLYVYVIDADAVAANPESGQSFVASVAAFARNNGVRFQIRSLSDTAANVTTANALLPEGLRGKLISDADVAAKGTNVKARRVFTTTANRGRVANAAELVEIEDRGGNVVPFHAAVPVVYLKDAGLAGSYQPLVLRLLAELYGRAPEPAEIDSFIRGTTIVLPRVGRFEINLSIRLAIAA